MTLSKAITERLCLLQPTQRKELVRKLGLDANVFPTDFIGPPADFINLLASQAGARKGITPDEIDSQIDSLFPEKTASELFEKTLAQSTQSSPCHAQGFFPEIIEKIDNLTKQIVAIKCFGLTASTSNQCDNPAQP